ncbi:hypothetical protein EFQ99_07385 [Rhizobium vallis]|uniref:Uncharacterized protein n=1 Tax=Rhizobium vallis TaxID=634290 RepID=A0A3S0QWQ4_9HYPH|nr:hypothetical protein [Rhizobium vallis]RUM26100.1 hypothetical protein EFQ99_07385 [Rhizobium vallis]
MLDAIAEHAYDERDIEIWRRIAKTEIVREICNHSPAERLTPRPIPFDQPAIVIPRCIEPAAGQVSQTVCRPCAEDEEM